MYPFMRCDCLKKSHSQLSIGVGIAAGLTQGGQGRDKKRSDLAQRYGYESFVLDEVTLSEGSRSEHSYNADHADPYQQNCLNE